MAHDFESIIREKIEQAEGARIEFDRERVWAGLTVAQTTTPSKPGWYYYAAAAAVLLLVGLAFFRPVEKPQRQLAQSKVVQRPMFKVQNKKEESVSPALAAPVSLKVEKLLGVKSKQQKAMVKETMPHLGAEEKIKQPEPEQLALQHEPAEPLKVTKPKMVRRKIEPIVGFVPGETFSTEVARPRAYIRLQLVHETAKETYANSGEPKSFKTRIN